MRDNESEIEYFEFTLLMNIMNGKCGSIVKGYGGIGEIVIHTQTKDPGR